MFLLNLGTSKNIRFDLEDEEFIQTGLTEIKEKPEGKKNKSKKRTFKGGKFPDYEQMEKTKKIHGLAGEKLVLDWEKNRLISKKNIIDKKIFKINVFLLKSSFI